MAEESVGQLAETVGTPVERLLLQMEEAGLPRRVSDDVILEDEKETLLAFLKKSHGEDEGVPKKITLKRRTLSTLKTGGSAGRGRTVNVEVRKKRTYVRRGTPEVEEAPEAEEAKLTEAPEVAGKVVDAEAERKRQEAAVELLAEQEEREQKAKEEEEKKRLSEEAAASSRKKKEPTIEEMLKETSISNRKDKRDRHDLDEEEVQAKKSKHGGRKRRVEELAGDDLLEVDLAAVKNLEDDVVVAEGKVEEATPLGLSSPRTRRTSGGKPAKRHKFNAPTEEIKREVELAESVTIQQLSQKMSVKASVVIKTLFGLGIMKTINESIDQETATLVAEEFGLSVKLLDVDAVEKTLEDELVYEAEEQHRAPVVTVMGHVDHGKTSLLDYIRSSRVASGEAGGITQHIGAYRVATNHGEICFIDTPGHAAFTAMRARGANATDIVILVVAADDGVMPQTEEAVQHAKRAGAPMVINKIDKEGAYLERVKNELVASDVVPEDWGGDTQFIPCSAITGAGIEELLEAVLLQAELLELKAVIDGPAQGVVIESELDKGKGPVATLLVQNGTLKQGDLIVAGQYFGRARALNDESGKQVKLAGPATPVVALGLNGTPNAGDSFIVAKDEKRAREVAEFRAQRATKARLNTGAGASLDSLLENFGADEVKRLNVIVKADVRGSLEAIVTALNDVGNEEVQVNVVMSGVGGITESDVSYAVTAGAVVFGFNVRADNTAKRVVESEGLDLRYYKVIYDLVDDVRDALSGMLSPEVREDIVGIAEVRDVFESKKMGQIAGSMVIEGTISRSKQIRVLRDNVVIYEGELESLRRFKDEVQNVSSGTECGIGVKNYDDVKKGDQIEVFDTREVAREL